MYERKYRTDYKVVRWGSPESLADIMFKEVNAGWRVDTHFIPKSSECGWTMFTMHTDLNQPLLERSVNVGEVYKILNHVFPCNHGDEPWREQTSQFDKALKSAVKQELD